MKLKDIPLRHKRGLIVDPISFTGWHLLTNSYVQDRFIAAGVRMDRSEMDRELVQHDLEGFSRSFIAFLQKAHETYDFIVSINRIPANMLEIIVGDKIVDMYSYTDIPIVTWLVDNIGHHSNLLLGRPLSNEITLVTDKSSVAAGKKLGHRISEDAFLCMWGGARKVEQPQGPTRDIPVIFSGDLRPSESLAELRQTVLAEHEGLGIAFDRVMEQMLEDKGQTDALMLLIDEMTSDGRQDEAPGMFKKIDPWLRRRRRKLLLRRFKSTKIRVLGKIEDEDLLAQENLETLGQVSVADTCRVAQFSKVMIGEFANFVDGVELRPSMAIANGCVLACEENKFLQENFPDNSWISLLDPDVDADEVFASYLADDDRLAEVDRRAGAFYEQQRTAPLQLGKVITGDAPKRIFDI